MDVSCCRLSQGDGPGDLPADAAVVWQKLSSKYASIQEPPAAGAPTPIVADVTDTEFFSLEKFLEKMDIVKRVELFSYHILLSIPKGMNPNTDKDKLSVWHHNTSDKSRAVLDKGALVLRCGNGFFHAAADAAGMSDQFQFPLRLQPAGAKRDASLEAVPEADAQLLWRADGAQEPSVKAVGALLTELSMVSGGTVYGFERTQEHRGNRKLKPSKGGAVFCISPSTFQDMDEHNMGQVLPPRLENYQTLFEYKKNAADLEPPNGGNAVAWVAKKKLHISCGRVVKMT